MKALRRHIAAFPQGVDGRLFVNRPGRGGVPLSPPYTQPVSMSVVYRTRHRAREAALTEQQVASPLARRPYDLRHACLSTWLNAGAPPAQVGAWAGHTVAVLLQVYSKCIDGQNEAVKRRIEDALGPAQPAAQQSSSRHTLRRPGLRPILAPTTPSADPTNLYPRASTPPAPEWRPLTLSNKGSNQPRVGERRRDVTFDDVERTETEGRQPEVFGGPPASPPPVTMP